MTRQEIQAELKKILVIVDEKLADKTITDDMSVREGMGLDSLQLAELLFEIEENLGAKITDEEAQKLKTVGDLLDLIQAKKA